MRRNRPLLREAPRLQADLAGASLGYLLPPVGVALVAEGTSGHVCLLSIDSNCRRRDGQALGTVLNDFLFPEVLAMELQTKSTHCP